MGLVLSYVSVRIIQQDILLARVVVVTVLCHSVLFRPHFRILRQDMWWTEMAKTIDFQVSRGKLVWPLPREISLSGGLVLFYACIRILHQDVHIY